MCWRRRASVTSATVSPFSRESIGVEPDADVALEVAAERELSDAGHRLELLLQPVARDVGDELGKNGPESPTHMIGWSSGFVLETTGGSRSRGSRRCAWEIFV